MSPVFLIEGGRRSDPVRERNRAEAQLSELAAAVREHEASVRRREYQVRPQDRVLYQRLRRICGD